MVQTYEAVIDEEGNVRLREPVHLSTTRRALVVILGDEASASIPETALMSEPALAEDWDRPEEDAAWPQLRRGRSSQRRGKRMPNATVTIDRSIAEVFAVLADLTTHPTWSPDVMNASKITDGPVKLGARFRFELKGIGEGELEITGYDEPTCVEFRGRSRMGDTRHLFSLTPAGERTKVDQELEMRPRGLCRLLTPVNALMLKRGVRRNAAGLELHFQGGAKAETSS